MMERQRKGENELPCQSLAGGHRYHLCTPPLSRLHSSLLTLTGLDRNVCVDGEGVIVGGINPILETPFLELLTVVFKNRKKGVFLF